MDGWMLLGARDVRMARRNGTRAVLVRGVFVTVRLGVLGKVSGRPSRRGFAAGCKT